MNSFRPEKPLLNKFPLEFQDLLQIPHSFTLLYSATINQQRTREDCVQLITVRLLFVCLCFVFCFVSYARKCYKFIGQG